jgi:hypothetical protein
MLTRQNSLKKRERKSTPVPHAGYPCVPHFLLKLENSIHQRLRSRRALMEPLVAKRAQVERGDQHTTRNIDINRDNPVAAADNRVAVMVVAATVGAASHTNNPPRIGHLIIYLSKGRCHLIRQGTRDNHDIGLSRRGSENDTETILIVPGCGQVHHLDGTAGKSKGHGP